MAKCKPCFGGGKLYGAFGDSWDCIPCKGTGERRTGPYRLADGTWSDGVDRTHAIPSHVFSKANPDRVYVHTSYEREAFGSWQPLFDVWRGDECIKTGWPFAEAIAYADRAARGQE